NRQVVIAIWQVNTLSPSKSVGLTGLHALDPTARLMALEAVLETAVPAMKEKASQLYQEPLFIFVAPEFLFSTVEGHFLQEEIKERIRLGLIAISKRYPEVLIVPGTIAWYKTVERSPSRAKRAGPAAPPRDFSLYLAQYDTEVHAPTRYAGWAQEALRGYQEDQREQFGERLKRNDPALKIARNTVFLLYQGDVWHKYSKRHESLDEHDLSLDVPGTADYKNIVFAPSITSPLVPPIQGLTIGIEICADHEHASLLNTGSRCDIQIVCSATVSVFREHASLKPTGILIQADSQTSGVYQPEHLGAGDRSSESIPLPMEEIKVRFGTLYVMERRMRV
ncbi:MAG: hypothetical protein R3247_11335, partial [Rhodothermales bacterium]|nr:hypothetical protein [Rhodothermales bacterium]